MACNHADLTADQKIKATELRRKGTSYIAIADLLDIEISVLRYRLPQYLRIMHPELLNNQWNRERPAKIKGLRSEDINHYRHNINTPPVLNRPSEVKVIISPNIKTLPEPTMELSKRIEARRLDAEKKTQQFVGHESVNNLYCASLRNG